MGVLEGRDTSRAGGLLRRRVGLGEGTPVELGVLFWLEAVTWKGIHGVMSFERGNWVWECPVGLGVLQVGHQRGLGSCGGGFGAL